MAITLSMRGVADARPLPACLPAGAPGYRCSAGHATMLAGAAALLAVGALADVPLAAGGPTVAACLLLLLAGLPHGALDIEVLQRGRTKSMAFLAVLLSAYVGLAGLMLLLWSLAPVLALVAFLTAALAHFGEDWAEAGHPFLAQGTAGAVLCTPALTHHDELAAVFASLSGDPHAAMVADGMVMLAPLCLVIAAATSIRLITLGRSAQAATTVIVLASMALFPPVIGFALFFCAHHSPRHLGRTWRDLTHARVSAQRLRWITVAITTAALGIAAALFAIEPRIGLTARAIAAAFITLSVLAVPHMTMPALLARLAGQRGPDVARA